MDVQSVLKRSWENVWRYKALWLFGLLLALTTTSWESALLFGSNDNNNPPEPVEYQLSQADREWLRERFDLTFEDSYSFSGEDVGEFFRTEIVQLALAVLVLVLAVSVLLAIITTMIRYLSETALIRMVNEHEKTGSQYGVRQGLRMAWSRSAWRLFVIDLAVRLPAIALFIVLFALVIPPIVGFASLGTVIGITGAVASGGFFFLLLAVAIVAAAVLEVLARLARQATIVDNLGVLASIRRSYRVMRYGIKDVGLLWLIMAGINLIWPLLMIPVVIALVGVGIAIVAIMVGVTGGAGALVGGGAGAWIAAGAMGGLTFLFVLIAPLAFLSGLRIIFESSSWTLTYRELRNVGPVPVKSEAKPAAV